MAPDPPRPAKPRRFQPKAQVRRNTPTAGEVEAQRKRAEDKAAEDERLRQQLSDLEANRRRRPAAKNKAPVQPSFINLPKKATPTSGSSASNVPQAGSQKESGGLEVIDLDDGGEPDIPWDGSGSEVKEYKELWGHDQSRAPITLPWRPPNSGDPTVLNEAEFGDAASNLEYDEEKINSAAELGFLDPDDRNAKLMFLQLPTSFPVGKRSASAKGKEIATTEDSSQQRCSFRDLPAGHMGKLLVYKSGAVKLRVGDIYYDVTPGTKRSFLEHLVAVNTKEKECCEIGKFHTHAVVTPDIDSLLDSENNNVD